MDTLQVIVLSILQGLTEFLPISSSGHLVLVPALGGWPDQGLAFDIAVHFGTLLAVVGYFRHEIAVIARDWSRTLLGGPATVNSTMGWAILFTTLIIGLAGLLLVDLVRDHARNPLLVASTTIGFGLLMGVADRYGSRTRSLDSLGWRDVLVIGLAQVLALVPGTSRSGITITAGMMMGLDRDAAARFSFLMAIPVIALAAAWQFGDASRGSFEPDWPKLLAGVAISCVVALACIHWFLRYLRRFTLMPFVIYRLVLGVILLAVFL